MRAVLIATGWNIELGALLAYRPSPLLNVVGKSIAHHVMDYLCHLGVKRCDIVLHHLPLSIRNSLGDGSRWSIQLNYHLCKDATTPFKTIIPVIQGWDEEVILLGTLDTLPQFTLSDKHNTTNSPILIYTPSKEWTKWGVFPLSALIKVPWDLSYDAIPYFFRNKSKSLPGKTLVSVESYRTLKFSNINSLKNHVNSINMPTTSKQIGQDTWISKGTTIHPNVKIIPPVFVGEDTYIEEQAEIGPNVVIESNCIVDRKSKISNSLVCKNSYVGEALNISNSVIDRNLLVNTNLKSEVSIIEDFILSEIKITPLKSHAGALIEKFLATLLLILFLPIIAAAWPFSKIKRKKVVSIPSQNLSPDPQTFNLFQWESSSGNKYPLFNSFIKGIPQLINIIRGELHFVGLPPRTAEEINTLPNSWKNLYLHSQTGIVNLADIEKPPKGDIDQLFACEMYQTINTSPLFALRLITRWVLSRS